MGGGNGFDPVSLVASMVVGAMTGSGGQQSGGGRVDNSAAEAAAQTARQEAEARQKADRKKAEAALLAKARQAERASQAAQDGAPGDGLAGTLGGGSGTLAEASAAVSAGQLKARLGQ